MSATLKIKRLEVESAGYVEFHSVFREYGDSQGLNFAGALDAVSRIFDFF